MAKRVRGRGLYLEPAADIAAAVLEDDGAEDHLRDAISVPHVAQQAREGERHRLRQGRTLHGARVGRYLGEELEAAHAGLGVLQVVVQRLVAA
eukprot:3614556-Rhodomonas_salina.1